MHPSLWEEGGGGVFDHGLGYGGATGSILHGLTFHFPKTFFQVGHTCTQINLPKCFLFEIIQEYICLSNNAQWNACVT
jgi:hypothetical protein